MLLLIKMSPATWVLLVQSFAFVKVEAKCDLLSDRNTQLIIDYIKWRNIHQVILLGKELKTVHNMQKLRENLKCFNEHVISFSIATNINATKPILSKWKRKVVNVVTVLRPNLDVEEFMSSANYLASYGDSISWLILSSDYGELIGENLLNVFRDVNFNIHSDVVLATTFNNTNEEPVKLQNHCKRNQTKVEPRKKIDRILPFYNLNNNNYTNGSNVTSYCVNTTEISNVSMCILHIYKLRKLFNTSLVIQPLGFWSYENGFGDVQRISPVEKRLTILNFPLYIGTVNTSSSSNMADENGIEETNDEENMNEISDYIASFLNAKKEVLTFNKVGGKDSSGIWTDLLGAVIKNDVDFGLYTVIKTPERYNDMSFSHSIMQSIRNIYVKPEKSEKLRDIFTVPFRFNLLACLLGTVILIAIALTIYTRIVVALQKQNCKQKVPSHFSDAALWCVAIFSMQGNIWMPRTYAGNIIVIASLLCALITYNSYSAFITSILSVQLLSIRSVDDLLESDYDIGYVKNSIDEIYLRSTNISQLNQIYLRGYLYNNIDNISDGLLKTTQGNYGFFASGHIARKQFINLSHYRCTYDIVEIPVTVTKNTVAFPMPKKSPFKHLINLGIIKMYESGILSYILYQISPPLPECQEERSYSSARLSDLSTAFFILIGGGIISAILLGIECLWKQRVKLFNSLMGAKTLHIDSNLHTTTSNAREFRQILSYRQSIDRKILNINIPYAD